MVKSGFKNVVFRVGMIVALFALLFTSAPPANAQGSRTFPETGQSVAGDFLSYWTNNGGLAQQGYPISGEFSEVSPLNGQTYTVQYFERAVFEKHPENAAPNNVLLSQLGKFQYRQKYGGSPAPGQNVNSTNPRTFPETGFTVGGLFRTYWEQHGGLAQQGYPISNEFQEKSDLNGQTYLVQYFERAVFEYHPENAAPNNVLLSQLGKFQYRAKYQGGGTTNPPAQPTAAPAQPTAAPTAPPAANRPANKDAQVTPSCGVAGTTFQIVAYGFTPNEALSLWYTTPAGDVVGTSNPYYQVPDSGGFRDEVQTTADFAAYSGWWAITYQGASSGHQSVGYFYIAKNDAECAGK